MIGKDFNRVLRELRKDIKCLDGLIDDFKSCSNEFDMKLLVECRDTLIVKKDLLCFMLDIVGCDEFLEVLSAYKYVVYNSRHADNELLADLEFLEELYKDKSKREKFLADVKDDGWFYGKKP